MICSANKLLPLNAWLQYDNKFCTIAASNAHLRWDQRHPDLWLEALALGNLDMQSSKRWPCPYCKTTTHFQKIVPVRLFVTTWNQIEQLITELPALQSAVTITMVTAPDASAPLSTSTCPAKAITLESSVQAGGHHLISHLLSPLRPLVLKRDQPCVRPLLNSEQTPSLQRNCHPADIQQLAPIEQHKVPTHISTTNQCITTAHLPHHLQQFITAHKSALHSRTLIITHHLHQELISHPDQVICDATHTQS